MYLKKISHTEKEAAHAQVPPKYFDERFSSMQKAKEVSKPTFGFGGRTPCLSHLTSVLLASSW